MKKTELAKELRQVSYELHDLLALPEIVVDNLDNWNLLYKVDQKTLLNYGMFEQNQVTHSIDTLEIYTKRVGKLIDQITELSDQVEGIKYE